MTVFNALWQNYPKDDPCDAKGDDGEPLFRNQCAIRPSQALSRSGVSLASFPRGRKCWIHKNRDEVLGAAELADWLEGARHPDLSKSINVTGPAWRSNVAGKTGILCFEDYYEASGSGGDHIDLWNGSALTGFGSWLRTRFNVVVPGLWSDFRLARRIRFFGVR